MEDNFESLALKHDLLVNTTLKFLDTSIERDYMLKSKIIDELTNKINEEEADKITIKNVLKEVQEECSKLSFKLKTSARLLNEIQVEKEALLIENKTLKSQLQQLRSVYKTPDNTEISLTLDSNFDQLDGKKTLNDTDFSYSSYSDVDNSCEHLTKNVNPQSALIKKSTITNNVLSNTNIKSYEIRNLNMNGNHIIATTTLTLNLDRVNAKSVIQTHPNATSRASPISSLNNSVELFYSDTSNEELEIEGFNNIVETNTEIEHNFIQKIIVIPEICEQCYLKIQFNNYMIKCQDCKTVAHLECKEHIPATCTMDQNKIMALKCGISPFIVHCIREIERRGMGTIGLYRISGSDKEMINLKEKIHNGVPNLNNVDIYVLCSCLKDFIRTNKYNLVSQYYLSKMTKALKQSTDISTSFRQIIIELPSANRNLLAFLILHLQKVASSPKCKMNYNCLAIVFVPTIFGLSSTSLDDLRTKSKMISKVVIEFLKLPTSFWNNILKTDNIAPDEFLYSTPTQSQSRIPSSTCRFFTPGLKGRILDSPQKIKAAKQVEFEKKKWKLLSK